MLRTTHNDTIQADHVKCFVIIICLGHRHVWPYFERKMAAVISHRVGILRIIYLCMLPCDTIDIYIPFIWNIYGKDATYLYKLHLLRKAERKGFSCTYLSET